MDLTTELDALYAGDPAGFVAGRDRLVRELRAQGRRSDADSIAKARRPSVAAAAVDRWALTNREEAEGLLALGARLRAAQQEAVTGGDSAELRALTGERRRLIAELTDRVARGLTEAARASVAATLEAALADEEVGEQLRRGRLTREASLAGFGLDLFALGASTAPRPPRRAAPAPTSRPSRLRVAPEPTPPPAPAAPVGTGRPTLRKTKTTAAAPATRTPDGEQAARRAREAAANDAEQVAAARAAVRAAEQALRAAKKELTEAERRARRSELAAATAEQKAWEAGERARPTGRRGR